MIRCDKCKVNISGNREYCPLCGKKIAAIEGAEDYDVFPVIPLKKENHIFLRIVTFISLALIVISEVINQVFMPEVEFGVVMCLGIACAYLFLFVGYKKRRNIRKTVMYEAIIGIVLSIIWDWYFGWNGWSISYVLPLTVVGLNVLYFIISLVDRAHQTDYGIYFLLTIAGTVIVIILNFAGAMLSVKLASVTAVIGILLLLAKIIFSGQSFWSEIVRRLHL